MEEGLRVEFKEVDRANPKNSIKSVVDDYAVAFLNRDGGRIFWGIRDKDRAAVGIRLDSRQRDEIRKLIFNKMSQLIPAPSPRRYAINLHPVIDGSGGSRSCGSWSCGSMRAIRNRCTQRAKGGTG
jgi:predicted HTH transcriptional regulator